MNRYAFWQWQYMNHRIFTGRTISHVYDYESDFRAYNQKLTGVAHLRSEIPGQVLEFGLARLNPTSLPSLATLSVLLLPYKDKYVLYYRDGYLIPG